MIELDFISVVIGYIAGVCLTWSLTFTLFGCEKCDNDKTNTNPYTDLYDDYYDGRIM